MALVIRSAFSGFFTTLAVELQVVLHELFDTQSGDTLKRVDFLGTQHTFAISTS